MIEFQMLTLQDAATLRPYLEEKQSKLSNYSFGATMIWRDWTHLYWAKVGDTLLLRAGTEQPAYLMPLGGDLEQAFSALEEQARTEEGILRFTCLDPEDLELVRRRFPNAAVSDPGWGDYVYDAASLRTLKGKKYEKKRNYVNRFKREHPDWRGEPITPDNLEQVREFYRRLSQDHENQKENIMFFAEQQKVEEILEHYDVYGMSGCAVYVGESIVGFALGEVLGDMAFEHVEKADVSYVGAYQMMVTTYANLCTTEDVKYINREDDAQDEGLRKSKQSYHPLFLTEKYDAEIALA